MNQTAIASKPPASAKVYTTLIIGSGISGMCMAINLKKAGITDLKILEKAERLGGRWRDNIYPGCGCDVMLHFYSYSFEPILNRSRKALAITIWKLLVTAKVRTLQGLVRIRRTS